MPGTRIASQALAERNSLGISNAIMLSCARLIARLGAITPLGSLKAYMEKELQKAMADAIKDRINEDRHHGWGADDSMAVIEAVIGEDASIEIARLIAGGKEPTLYTPTEAALKLIKRVVNPSAFRQWLEGQKRPDGETILAKSDKKGREREFFPLYS